MMKTGRRARMGKAERGLDARGRMMAIGWWAMPSDSDEGIDWKRRLGGREYKGRFLPPKLRNALTSPNAYSSKVLRRKWTDSVLTGGLQATLNHYSYAGVVKKLPIKRVLMQAIDAVTAILASRGDSSKVTAKANDAKLQLAYNRAEACENPNARSSWAVLSELTRLSV
ncbi:hypothetical protein R1sor_026267 [Riccia sorocarpa]|uniref:Uncharacterized protein n=1 Tax=Riccia sorocarpa TaxID=122646 RepID=A0ABD3GCZ2_9MARC